MSDPAIIMAAAAARAAPTGPPLARGEGGSIPLLPLLLLLRGPPAKKGCSAALLLRWE
jgi:hypothetical protein